MTEQNAVKKQREDESPEVTKSVRQRSRDILVKEAMLLDRFCESRYKRTAEVARLQKRGSSALVGIATVSVLTGVY